MNSTKSKPRVLLFWSVPIMARVTQFSGFAACNVYKGVKECNERDEHVHHRASVYNNQEVLYVFMNNTMSPAIFIYIMQRSPQMHKHYTEQETAYKSCMLQESSNGNGNKRMHIHQSHTKHYLFQ